MFQDHFKWFQTFLIWNVWLLVKRLRACKCSDLLISSLVSFYTKITGGKEMSAVLWNVLAISTRHRSLNLIISRTFSSKIWHTDLGKKAYKVQLVQWLKPPGHPNRHRKINVSNYTRQLCSATTSEIVVPLFHPKGYQLELDFIKIPPANNLNLLGITFGSLHFAYNSDFHRDTESQKYPQIVSWQHLANKQRNVARNIQSNWQAGRKICCCDLDSVYQRNANGTALITMTGKEHSFMLGKQYLLRRYCGEPPTAFIERHSRNSSHTHCIRRVRAASRTRIIRVQLRSIYPDLTLTRQTYICPACDEASYNIALKPICRTPLSF